MSGGSCFLWWNYPVFGFHGDEAFVVVIADYSFGCLGWSSLYSSGVIEVSDEFVVCEGLTLDEISISNSFSISIELSKAFD